MPSPCKSLILRVEHDLEGEEQVDLGVQIWTSSGEPLQPGTAEMAAELNFWADLADVYVVPGMTFTLRYPARIVGRGQVLAMLPV
jgi:hypothetical protein